MKENINTERFWNHKYGRKEGSPPTPLQLLKGPHKPLYEKIVDIIFSIKHDRILDLGAGSGVVAFLLKKRSFDFKNRKYVCVDFSNEGLALAKQYNSAVSVHYSRVDQEIKGLKASSYDIVICTEVLEHLTNYMECLKNIRKYLFSTGISIVSIPHGRIMVKDHYHMNIPLELMISCHEAIDLSVFATYNVSRWNIIKSKRYENEQIDKNIQTSTINKDSSKRIITDLRI